MEQMLLQNAPSFSSFSNPLLLSNLKEVLAQTYSGSCAQGSRVFPKPQFRACPSRTCSQQVPGHETAMTFFGPRNRWPRPCTLTPGLAAAGHSETTPHQTPAAGAVQEHQCFPYLCRQIRKCKTISGRTYKC